MSEEGRDESEAAPLGLFQMEGTTEVLDLQAALYHSAKASEVVEISEFAEALGLGDVAVMRCINWQGLLGPDDHAHLDETSRWVSVLFFSDTPTEDDVAFVQNSFVAAYFAYEFNGSRWEFGAALYAAQLMCGEPMLSPESYESPNAVSTTDTNDWWGLGAPVDVEQAHKIMRKIAELCMDLNSVPLVMHIVRIWLDRRPDDCRTPAALVRAFEQNVPFRSITYLRHYKVLQAAAKH